MKNALKDLIEKVNFSTDEVKPVKKTVPGLFCEECLADGKHTLTNEKGLFICSVCVEVRQTRERSKGMF